MTKTNDIKKKLTKKKKTSKTSHKDFLSTGSSLLDLACTGRVGRGFIKGKYYYLVGDSMSGKTFLSLTCLAEASINHNFDEYRFIYDSNEEGALMDIQQFFGKGVAERMEPASLDDAGRPCPSTTIEEFYYHLDDAIEQGRPFIYILDSMDSLSSEAEGEKFSEQKKAHQANKKIAGSYGDGKAKRNSSGIRQMLPALRATGSILIIISQTRDNLGFGPSTKTRSGGKALRFYATLEIWSSCGPKIKKQVKGKKRTIGVTCILEVKKNRITGRNRKVETPIYYAIGIDDIGGCVQWLIEEEHWKKKGNTVIASELDFEGTEAVLIKHIEDEGLEKDLRLVVQEVWDEIEEACDPGRKRRYE